MTPNSNTRSEKLKLFVCTDIVSLTPGYMEPDDSQSLIRLLCFSDLFDIRGIVATAHKTIGTHMHIVDEILDAYEKVYDKFCVHSSEFPTPAYLRSISFSGSEQNGLENMGEGKDTEGSMHIVRAINESDTPIWFVLWGGALDLAQAIWYVDKNYSEEDAKAWRAKIRIYSIGDQYDNAGPWIREHYPDIHYLSSYGAYRGVYRDGDVSLSSSEWVEENIKGNGHPLATIYPNYNGGDPWGEVKGIKEGDTPSFLFLIPNGLCFPNQPELGGWGGRFQTQNGIRYTDDVDNWEGEAAPRSNVFRWREAFNSEFVARLRWVNCTPAEAIYPPIIEGAQQPEVLNVRAGESISLKAPVVHVTNGNEKFSYRWFVYPEVENMPELVTEGNDVRFTVPADTKQLVVNFAVKNGDFPSITRYKRWILHVDA